MIFHPVSNDYVREVAPIFRECARVLKKGGQLMCGLSPEINFIVDNTEKAIVNHMPFDPIANEAHRRQLEADAANLFEFVKDPDIGPAAGRPPHRSVEESLNVIRNVFSGEQYRAICETGSDVTIGAIELKLNGNTNLTARDDEREPGYRMAKPYRGKGYMPEAARELLRYAFENLGMRAV